MLLTTINSIMAFDLFWTMTKGGPGSATTVFSWLGYAYAFQLSKFGEGAAILYILTDRLPAPGLGLSEAVHGDGAARLAAAPPPRRPRRRATLGARGRGADAGWSSCRHSAAARCCPAGRAGSPAGRPGAGGRLHLRLVVRALPLARGDEPVDLGRSRADAADPDPRPLTLENYRFVLFPTGVADGQSSVQATRVPSRSGTASSSPSASPASTSCSARSPATPMPGTAGTG